MNPTESQKCVFVIFNPVSGKSDPEQRKKAISDALAEEGYTCQFIATTKEQGAKALAEQAIKEGADLLAVSGGDGTVMEALSALVGTDIPIAVLPAGTGNLLSVNLGIPLTVPEAVKVALSGKPYALDLAKTTDGRHFAIMGGLGLDAQMIADTDRKAKDKMGKLAYFLAALKNLPRQRSSFEITLDERRPIRRRAKTVLIANMGKIGGQLEAMPTASPHDGLLDVGILKTATLAQWVRLMAYAALGRTQDDPALEVYQARKITLRALRPERVEYDGEDGGQTQHIIVEVVPKAVHVLLPENAPASRNIDEPPAIIARQTAERRLMIPLFALLLLGLFFALRRRKRE